LNEESPQPSIFDYHPDDMFKKTNPEVNHYFAAAPGEHVEMLSKLHNMIMVLYPDAVVDMTYRMPTYKFKSGWVALANQKHYVSLYTCGSHHIAEFKERYPDIKTGKGCINFKRSDRIPVTALKKVIRHAIQHPKAF